VRVLAGILAAAALAAAGALPAETARAVRPAIAAPSYVAIDAATGRVIMGRNAYVRRPIASLTKVMTGLLVIERGLLSRRVRVTRQAVRVEPYREGLVVGVGYQRRALLWSALLASSNDSATALAIDGGEGSLRRFYAAMNAKARELGMRRTIYASASGLDDRRNLSTALDQARLARSALEVPLFATIVSARAHRSPWPVPPHTKRWVNHNKLLGWAPGTYGVKTGWTTRAGGCLIVSQKRGDRRVIAVVLGSPSIWSDIATLLDRAFARAVSRQPS
jgi:serine-type D-Ala-D-Ala carboxypeptidase (penicillin-binding protein 5/6)